MWRDDAVHVPPDHAYGEKTETKPQVLVSKKEMVPIVKGDFHMMPSKVQQFVSKWIDICKPQTLHICDGGEREAEAMIKVLVDEGSLVPLKKLVNCYLARTDPGDVARVEGKTWVCTKDKYATVPHVRDGVTGELGRWMSVDQLNQELLTRMPGCMSGRCMYVIPFSMGPIGGALSKVGIQVTDSMYVALSMRIMTRVHEDIWSLLNQHSDPEFVRCVHSVGCPLPTDRKVMHSWPCNPERTLVSHIPDERMIISYGSGYGGNSLLGKKCFALRIASKMGHDEDWMAEHMLIMSYEKNGNNAKHIVAAFPSGCGKTNLAMLSPTLPEYKIRCIGDDITWMRFDQEGLLRGINPEFGFFGIAPGTNMKTNPNAMKMVEKNCIFTNVAETTDGSFYWQGMENEVEKGTKITTWTNAKIKVGEEGSATPAHPNSRFCCPVQQCPIIHPQWFNPDGFPVDVIMFGGRRPQGMPLVFEAFNWKHGVTAGASIKSEATAATADLKCGSIVHDPFAMRPFMGYNFAQYMQHWLDQEQPGRKMPRIFYVNWFRRGSDNKFLWPGYGENIRVLDWIEKRLNDPENKHAVWSPIGWLPKKESFRLEGLDPKVAESWDELFDVPTDWWLKDTEETENFLDGQCGDDLPVAIREQLSEQKKRLHRREQ